MPGACRAHLSGLVGSQTGRFRREVGAGVIRILRVVEVVVVSHFPADAVSVGDNRTVLCFLVPVDFESGGTAPVHGEVESFPCCVHLEAEVILRCSGVSLKGAIVIVTIYAVTVEVIVDDVAIPDFVFAISCFLRCVSCHRLGHRQG